MTSRASSFCITAPIVISIVFLLVISRLKQSEGSLELRKSSPKMNSLDIFITSPHYFYRECMQARKENFYFDIAG